MRVDVRQGPKGASGPDLNCVQLFGRVAGDARSWPPEVYRGRTSSQGDGRPARLAVSVRRFCATGRLYSCHSIFSGPVRSGFVEVHGRERRFTFLSLRYHKRRKPPGYGSGCLLEGPDVETRDTNSLILTSPNSRFAATVSFHVTQSALKDRIPRDGVDIILRAIDAASRGAVSLPKMHDFMQVLGPFLLMSYPTPLSDRSPHLQFAHLRLLMQTVDGVGQAKPA